MTEIATNPRVSARISPLVPERERQMGRGWKLPLESEVAALQALRLRVDDRIRTGDRLDHNQELYQLSYVHRAAFNLAGRRARRCT
jgi:hypothetical protein